MSNPSDVEPSQIQPEKTGWLNWSGLINLDTLQRQFCKAQINQLLPNKISGKQWELVTLGDATYYNSLGPIA